MKNHYLKNLENKAQGSEELYFNTLLFIETIEYGDGQCELIYNFNEEKSFTLRNSDGRPFKLIEWFKQFLTTEEFVS